MARHRARLYQLESLESKHLLSTLHAVHHHAPKPAALVLDGTLQGVLGQKVDTSNFKTSSFHSEEAVSGSIKSLGRVQANIVVDTKYSLNSPRPSTHSEIVLQGSKGSVTLNYGPDFVSEKVMPNATSYVYQYTVVSGAGAYSGASGKGTVTWTDTGSGWGFPDEKVMLKLHTTH